MKRWENSYLQPLHRPVHANGSKNLKCRGGTALTTFSCNKLRQILLFNLVYCCLVEANMCCTEIEVKRKRQWVFPDSLRSQVSLEYGSIVIYRLNQTVMSIPEARIAGTARENAHVFEAETGKLDHYGHRSVGGQVPNRSEFR